MKWKLLVKNVTHSIIQLCVEGRILQIFPWHTKEVPEEFQRDPFFRLSLDAGSLQIVEEVILKASYAEHNAGDEVLAEPAPDVVAEPEVVPEEETEVQEPKMEPTRKTSRKR